MLVVHEFLTPVQWLALGCVVVASVGATRSESTLTAPVPD
jgi:inner membrane transporter RhtA